MRRVLVGMAATATTVVLAIGGGIVGAPAASPTRTQTPSTVANSGRAGPTASPAFPWEVTVLPPLGPFVVGTLEVTFTDPDRPTPSRGATPATPDRSIATTVYYPVRSEPTADDPTPRAAIGPFPLVVFAHGFAVDAAAYAPLLTDLAAAGYVVAAPDFPGTSTRSPGSPNRSDLVQQPGDVSFVISSLLDVTTRPGPLFSMIDGNAIGVAGQSDGGVTAAAAAFNTSCLDPRIRAAAILTGGSFGFTGVWFPPGTPPALYVHATADQVNPYAASVSMFTRTQSAKYLVTVTGGSHFEVYVDDPWEDEVVATTVAFYDLHLKGMATAADRLTAVGTSGDLSLEVG